MKNVIKALFRTLLGLGTLAALGFIGIFFVTEFMLLSSEDRELLKKLQPEAKAAAELCIREGSSEWVLDETSSRTSREKAVKGLLDLLQTPRPDLRACAARTLGYTRDSKHLDTLIDSLNDESDYVRVAAVYGLAELGDPKALPHLRKLTQDKAPNMHSAVEHALKELEKKAGP
ncbi:MAG: HEAT repeat domain-containing protein [Elusimicrobiota bacterium]